MNVFIQLICIKEHLKKDQMGLTLSVYRLRNESVFLSIRNTHMTRIACTKEEISMMINTKYILVTYFMKCM